MVKILAQTTLKFSPEIGSKLQSTSFNMEIVKMPKLTKIVESDPESGIKPNSNLIQK